MCLGKSGTLFRTFDVRLDALVNRAEVLRGREPRGMRRGYVYQAIRLLLNGYDSPER